MDNLTDTNISDDFNASQKDILKPSLNFRKIVFVSFYLLAVPVFVIFLVLSSLYFKYSENGYIARQTHQLRYQALPETNEKSFVTLSQDDGRVENLNAFFRQYNSPLIGHAQTIVEEADRYNIDYRLLPAIAMQESTLCKKIIKDSYNCWGFGIYGKKVTRFSSYDEAIKHITKTLSLKYVHNGYADIKDIVRKYTPSDTGRWESVVSMIMNRLEASL